MTEDQLEQETLGWLVDAGYSQCYGLRQVLNLDTTALLAANRVIEVASAKALSK